jgi:hypothetical protein
MEAAIEKSHGNPKMIKADRSPENENVGLLIETSFYEELGFEKFFIFLRALESEVAHSYKCHQNRVRYGRFRVLQLAIKGIKSVCNRTVQLEGFCEKLDLALIDFFGTLFEGGLPNCWVFIRK